METTDPQDSIMCEVGLLHRRLPGPWTLEADHRVQGDQVAL